jgi:hypothetical protein
MESIEEIILALRAAGWDAPDYEVLPDGSYHFFHGNKEANSLISSIQAGHIDQGNGFGHQEFGAGNASA